MIQYSLGGLNPWRQCSTGSYPALTTSWSMTRTTPSVPRAIATATRLRRVRP